MPEWWGPYWKQGTWLNWRYIKGLAKIDAKAISRIVDPKIRARACERRFALLVQMDGRLDQRWFRRKCRVEG